MGEHLQHNLVVRNTFIDAVVADDEAYEAPERTRSDPTGGRSKDLVPLGRIPDRPMPISVKEGTPAEEAGELEPMRITEQFSGNLCGIDEEEEDDEDEGIGALGKTRSIAYPKSVPLGGRLLAEFGAIGSGPSASSQVTTMALNSLLPEEDEATRLARSKEAEASMAAAPYSGLDPNAPAFSAWGFPNPYDMYGGYGAMYPFPPYPQAVDEAAGTAVAAQEDSAPSDWHPPALGSGPPVGALHSFHQETRDMGQVSADFRTFTKVGYEGRLSVVSESRVHTDGMHRYLVQFAGGELSRADGVGFVFSPRLPCAKNIQRIVSIFVNQRGRICMRVFADIVRASAYVKPLELGDWVEMAIDLDQQVVTFNIWARTPTGWPQLEGRPSSTAEFPYGSKLAKMNQDGGQQAHKAKQMKLNTGHLACVVKNIGVTVTLGS